MLAEMNVVDQVGSYEDDGGFVEEENLSAQTRILCAVRRDPL